MRLAGSLCALALLAGCPDPPLPVEHVVVSSVDATFDATFDAISDTIVDVVTTEEVFADAGDDAVHDALVDAFVDKPADVVVDAGADVAPTPATSPVPIADKSEVAPGLTADDVARWFAPIWYQDTANNGPDGIGAKADVPGRVDYDGDLQHSNNWDSATSKEVRPYLYYGLVATETHYFLTYSQYHARDWDQVCTGLFGECHEGDLETIRLVIARDDTGYGTVLLLRTHAHGVVSSWSNDPAVTNALDSLDGGFDFDGDDGSISAVEDATHHHVRIFAESKGHGIAPCTASESFIKPFGILAVSCPDGKGADFPGGDGIRFVPGAAGEAPPAYVEAWKDEDTPVPYGLEADLHTLWAWRHEIGTGKVWRDKDAAAYLGMRGPPFATADKLGMAFDVDQFTNDDSTGVSPWNEAMSGSNQGDAFLDPAAAYPKAHAFPKPWSTLYTYHPYLAL